MAIHKNERTVDGDSRCVEPWGGYLGAAFFLALSLWGGKNSGDGKEIGR